MDLLWEATWSWACSTYYLGGLRLRLARQGAVGGLARCPRRILHFSLIRVLLQVRVFNHHVRILLLSDILLQRRPGESHAV